MPVEPLAVQRDAAVHNLLAAVAIYGGIAIVSGVAVAVHKARGML